MFARSNFIQNSLSKVSEHVKSDEELIREMKEGKEVGDLDITEEFGESSVWLAFGYLVHFCRLFVDNGPYEPHFTISIVLTIVLAGILVGIDTYDSLKDLEVLQGLEIFVLVVFAAECIIKILAEGTKPWKFFMGAEGAWNSFDFVVVIFCMPFFSDIFGNNSPAIRIISRLFRLFRVAKIVHQIPALQVIVRGLVGGLKSIVYVATLLLLVFYLYAIFGVYMFKENDPFYFRSVPIALLTLFRVCTLENWGDNMYINMFGCDEFDGQVYLVQDDIPAAEWNELHHFYKCKTPIPQPELSGLYFISFTVISSLVMLSLFIGVITMSMQESLNDMRREVEESNRKKRLLKAEEEMEKLSVRNTALTITKKMSMIGGGSSGIPISGKRSPNSDGGDSYAYSDTDSSDSEEDNDYIADMTPLQRSITELGRSFNKSIRRAKSYIFNTQKQKKSLSSKERKALRDMAEMKALMMQAWQGTKACAEYHHDLDINQEGTFEFYLRHAGIFSRSVVENAHFTNFITCVIIATAIIVGVETDYRNSENSDVFEVLENIIFAIFAAEVVLRFLADDCHLTEYFSNGWNTFDFLVVAFSKVPGGGAIVVLLRLVRLLRVLKVVKTLPQLAVIVSALLMGLSSIGYIGIIMFLTFYLFAILGIILFKGNDSFNFGTLHQAIVALFKIATLDNWGDALYINVYGCDVYPPYFVDHDKMFECLEPSGQPGAATAYFALFIVVGSLVMITLFVGVVTTSMEEATRLQMVELEIETRIMDLCHERSVTLTQLEIYRRVFSMLDLDGGGTIEGEELKSGLQAVNIECNDEQLETWVKEVDENSDGVIDLIEFIIFMTNMKKKALEEAERAAMRRGADGFLKMRKKAQARKLAQMQTAGTTSANKPDSGVILPGNAHATGSMITKSRDRRKVVVTEEFDGEDCIKKSPSLMQRASSSFFSLADTQSKSPDNKNSSSFSSFLTRAKTVVFGDKDVVEDFKPIADGGEEERNSKNDKVATPSAIVNPKSNTVELLEDYDDFENNEASPASSDNAEKTAELSSSTTGSTSVNTW